MGNAVTPGDLVRAGFCLHALVELVRKESADGTVVVKRVERRCVVRGEHPRVEVRGRLRDQHRSKTGVVWT